MKITKGSVITLLTIIAGTLTYALSGNPKYGFIASLIGYALGDAITFLQSSTLSDKWTYASKSVLAIAILSTLGTLVGQYVSANAISPYIGGLVGYAIAEAIVLLSPTPTTPPPIPRAMTFTTTPPTNGSTLRDTTTTTLIVPA